MADYPQKIRADRVKEATATTGTSTYILGGAPQGFLTFLATVPDNGIFDYGVTEIFGPSWENGLGRYSTVTNSVQRVQIYSSSNNNQAVNWADQAKQIFLTVNAASIVALTDDSVLNSLILG